MNKRIISLLIAIVMLLGVLPFGMLDVHAEDATTASTEETTEESTEASTEASTEESTEATTEESTEATEEETENIENEAEVPKNDKPVVEDTPETGDEILL